jgi:hypothetical protein
MRQRSSRSGSFFPPSGRTSLSSRHTAIRLASSSGGQGISSGASTSLRILKVSAPGTSRAPRCREPRRDWQDKARDRLPDCRTLPGTPAALAAQEETLDDRGRADEPLRHPGVGRGGSAQALTVMAEMRCHHSCALRAHSMVPRITVTFFPFQSASTRTRSIPVRSPYRIWVPRRRWKFELLCMRLRCLL